MANVAIQSRTRLLILPKTQFHIGQGATRVIFLNILVSLRNINCIPLCPADEPIIHPSIYFILKTSFQNVLKSSKIFTRNQSVGGKMAEIEDRREFDALHLYNLSMAMKKSDGNNKLHTSLSSYYQHLANHRMNFHKNEVSHRGGTNLILIN